jgi:crotonobetainyl-CoA:carnitine CoA-transferase CaiB-like acyl-CoA transferase
VSASRITTGSLPADALPAPGAWPEFGLLDGVRVLDLTNSIAGPYATLLLADLGAEVVKVEPPDGGDDTRAWGPPFLDGASLWYLSANRNKGSLTLDLRSQEGAALLQRLLPAADVVVLNMRPAVQERLGMAYAQIAVLRPDVVHCSITGFGLTGRRADMACYDLIAEGYSGVMDLTGEPETPPQKVGTPAADLLAGMDAALAVVAALLDRERTGRGHQIDVSLTESMTRFLAPRILPYLGSGVVPRRTGGRDSVIAVYQRFETDDDPITLGLGNDRIFARFCAAVERPAWVDDPRNASNVTRRRHREELVEAIQEVLLTRGRGEWLARFEQHDVPAGPINTVADVTADDALLERGLFYAIQTGDGEHDVPQVGTGWHLDGAPNGHIRRPPALGADTIEILASWAGVEAAEIEALRERGVV